MTSGRQHRRGRYRKPPTDPAGSETLCMHGIFMRENREIPRLPSHPNGMRAARRRLRPYARDERSWEVGSPHSTDEAAEQCRGTGCGGGGGKGATQGERDQQIASRTQCRTRCVTCAGSRASSRASARPGARPERGAQCGSSARWDLCGGPPERVVPTATPCPRSQYHWLLGRTLWPDADCREPQTSGNRLSLPRQAGSPQNRVGQNKINSKLRNILY